jgi:hypothetical protein
MVVEFREEEVYGQEFVRGMRSARLEVTVAGHGSRLVARPMGCWSSKTGSGEDSGTAVRCGLGVRPAAPNGPKRRLDRARGRMGYGVRRHTSNVARVNILIGQISCLEEDQGQHLMSVELN